jgi:hypothetical protein
MKAAAAATILLVACSGAAFAQLPRINATCPGNIEFHSDENGPAYINGNEAKLEVFGDSAYDASNGEVTISVEVMPDGTASVAYTAPGGANGICQVAGG